MSVKKGEKGGCLGGCFKYLVIIVVIVAVCNFIANLDIDSGIKGNTTTNVVLNTDDTYCAYYEVLNPTEKHIYEELLAAVRDGKMECRIEGIDYDLYSQNCGRAAIAMTYDHPELFWVQGSSSWRGNRGLLGSGSYIEISLVSFEYWQYTVNPDKYTSAMSAEVKRVADMASAYSTEYEKAKFVHDYLANTILYDHDALAEAEKTVHDADVEYIYSAYGALVDKKAVCEGYAKSFQLIMNELGIPCTIVKGDSRSTGGYHAWNRVVMGGESYYMDVTWDDHDLLDDWGRQMYPEETCYDFFCLTTEELERDHIIEEIYFEDVPCNGTQYDYFEYNDYELSTYTLKGVAEIFDRQAAQEIVSVRFTNKAAYDKAMVALFDKDDPEINDIASLKNWKRYGWNGDQYIITVYK
ncbi:MAG: hypothetical protein IJ518_05055 [Clostridia bacterium]|nr:hypothetical protein [Clostridia bacterium]